MQVIKSSLFGFMTQLRRSPCPVACTLDLIGDRWTLLVIRDMMFFGKQRYEEFLESPEGISTNILANRLKLLEEASLIAKQPYSSHSRRMNYQLTEKGKSLRPVLKVMVVWGLKHIPDTQTPHQLPKNNWGDECWSEGRRNAALTSTFIPSTSSTLLLLWRDGWIVGLGRWRLLLQQHLLLPSKVWRCGVNLFLLI